MNASSLVAFSLRSSLSDRETTPLACEFIADHSNSDGRWSGIETPSSVARCLISFDLATQGGMSALLASKSKSGRKRPAHSTDLDSWVVQDALSSMDEDDSISSLRSGSEAEAATPLLARDMDALDSIKDSSLLSSGHDSSDSAPRGLVTASGNLLARTLASGLSLPDWSSESLSTRAFTESEKVQFTWSRTFPSTSTTLDSLQSYHISMVVALGLHASTVRMAAPQKKSNVLPLCGYMDIRLLALVAIGGAIGASLRYSIQSSFEPGSEPYATVGVNLLGSLLLGSIFGAIAAGTALSEGTVAILGTGVLGSFTTMSAFAMDYIEFSEESHSTAIMYALITILGSIGLAWAGYRTTLELIS